MRGAGFPGSSLGGGERSEGVAAGGVSEAKAAITTAAREDSRKCGG